jgi:tRNA threonylcarbamoyladenosine biosynthesis protein TsaB
MRVLALDTSTPTGSIAVLSEDQVVAELVGDPSKPHGQRLPADLLTTIAAARLTLADIDLLAVAVGPGSFTGLRIGVTTAKALAYGLDCRLVGVHTFAAIAERAGREIPELSVVLDAQRQQLFVGRLARDRQGGWSGFEATGVEERESWLASLAAGEVVSGPGLEPLIARLPPGVRALEPEVWRPTAAAVGRVARRLAAAGKTQGAFDLVPHYFRRTAAEEQWDRREQGRDQGKTTRPK